MKSSRKESTAITFAAGALLTLLGGGLFAMNVIMLYRRVDFATHNFFLVTFVFLVGPGVMIFSRRKGTVSELKELIFDASSSKNMSKFNRVGSWLDKASIFNGVKRGVARLNSDGPCNSLREELGRGRFAALIVWIFLSMGVAIWSSIEAHWYYFGRAKTFLKTEEHISVERQNKLNEKKRRARIEEIEETQK
ncbi:MAG: hypothetical protein JXR76_21755 [Deltaproteobacteria bacterium]|nr:hypothetical protein [Deltaproteobacteria bacterium]